jgi:hypothetical protein
MQRKDSCCFRYCYQSVSHCNGASRGCAWKEVAAPSSEVQIVFSASSDAGLSVETSSSHPNEERLNCSGAHTTRRGRPILNSSPAGRELQG